MTGTQYTVSQVPTCDELLERAMREVQWHEATAQRLRSAVRHLRDIGDITPAGARLLDQLLGDDDE